jgi:ABC-type Zn uptake system ZnuABC Zn-binding protein ZnuA
MVTVPICPLRGNPTRMPPVKLLKVLLPTAAAMALALAACGSDDEAGAADGPTIVATTGVAADIVAAVAGEDAEVIQLVPDGAGPHSYAPSAREQQELADADLLVYFSTGLEEALPLDGAVDSFEIADHVAATRTFAEGEVEDEHDRGGGQEADDDRDHESEVGDEHGHEAGATDPHVWTDPTRIESALPELADALGEIDREHAASYRQRAEAYAEELDRLDAELARMVDEIPAANRKLVTSHDVLGYFADRYGLEFVGAPFGLSPEAEASAGGVAELIGLVETEGVPAVFAQTGDDPKVLRQVADEAGVEVVDDLLVESLSGDADSYVEMMELTGRRIADALSG